MLRAMPCQPTAGWQAASAASSQARPAFYLLKIYLLLIIIIINIFINSNSTINISGNIIIANNIAFSACNGPNVP